LFNLLSVFSLRINVVLRKRFTKNRDLILIDVAIRLESPSTFNPSIQVLKLLLLQNRAHTTLVGVCTQIFLTGLLWFWKMVHILLKEAPTVALRGLVMIEGRDHAPCW
jgi:hypothetical protein